MTQHKPQEQVKAPPTAVMVLHRAVEQATGEQVDIVRGRTISETRNLVEQRQKKPMRFISQFPFVGRGNVMRDRIVDRSSVEELLDNALRDE